MENRKEQDQTLQLVEQDWQRMTTKPLGRAMSVSCSHVLKWHYSPGLENWFEIPRFFKNLKTPKVRILSF